MNDCGCPPYRVEPSVFNGERTWSEPNVMKLTKLQLRTFKQYTEYRSVEPTLLRIMMQGWKACLYIFVFVPAFGCFLIWNEGTSLGWLLIGISVGILSKVIGNVRAFNMVWPALRELIDWEKLNALVQENETDAR